MTSPDTSFTQSGREKSDNAHSVGNHTVACPSGTNRPIRRLYKVVAAVMLLFVAFLLFPVSGKKPYTELSNQLLETQMEAAYVEFLQARDIFLIAWELRNYPSTQFREEMKQLKYESNSNRDVFKPGYVSAAKISLPLHAGNYFNVVNAAMHLKLAHIRYEQDLNLVKKEKEKLWFGLPSLFRSSLAMQPLDPYSIAALEQAENLLTVNTYVEGQNDQQDSSYQ